MSQQQVPTLFEQCSFNYTSLSLSLRNDSNFGTTAMNSSNNSSNSNSIDTNSIYNIFLDESIINCISTKYNSIESTYKQHQNDFNRWMVLLMGALVFFMQCGFAMVCAGSVRRKNIQNTMLKNLLDAAISAITYYTIGYAFAYGGTYDTDTDTTTITKNTFIGTRNFFSKGSIQNHMEVWFFQYALSATCVTIVAGSLAERCQMGSYLMYCVYITSFVFPVIAHAIWSTNGFLSISSTNPFNDIGCIDFSGSGVIHLTGGTTAFIATILLGPRSGRFYNIKGQPLKKPKQFPGHSVALHLMGTLTLWFGWYGFNAGSALLLTNTPYIGNVAARAVANTSLAGGFGAVSALFCNMYYQREVNDNEYSFSLPMAMNGALSGLVAITAGCATVELWAGALIGAIGGILYMISSLALLHLRIDDVVDGIPVHFTNGMWGMIATGLFTSPNAMKIAYGTDTHVGLFYSIGRSSFDGTLVLNQLVAILFICGWTIITMYPFFKLLDRLNWFRTGSIEEVYGLDIQYHGTIITDAKAELEEDIAIHQQQQMLLAASSEHNNGNESKTRKSSSNSDGKKRSKRSSRKSSVTSSSIATSSVAAAQQQHQSNLHSHRTSSSTSNNDNNNNNRIDNDVSTANISSTVDFKALSAIDDSDSDDENEIENDNEHEYDNDSNKNNKSNKEENDLLLQEGEDDDDK